MEGNDETRIVFIDTFLAKVTDVTEVKYDADGHPAKDATLTLCIYNEGNPVVLKDDTNFSYARAICSW